MTTRRIRVGSAKGVILYDDVEYPDGPLGFEGAGLGDILQSDGSGNFGFAPGAAGGAAPIGAQYIVVANDGDLTAERRLQGTANQIILADGGANGDMVLSAPQDIHTAATPQFAGLGIGTGGGTSIVQIEDATNLGAGTNYADRTAPLFVTSDGTVGILFDSNQIESTAQLFVNFTSGQNIRFGGSVGIGVNPTYELDVAGNIGLDQFLYHNDDPNTYLNFTPDFFGLTVGGFNLFSINPSLIWINENSGDTDFLISSDTVVYALLVQGSDGFVGIDNSAPTIPFDVKAKAGFTSIGGLAIKLTNKTGGNTVAGQLVSPYSATAVEDAFKTSAANSDEVFGIVYEAGVADGSEAWVVISGVADVLMDGGGSARGDRIISSATAGSADVWNVGGAVATHFLEIGHCIESTGGAGLARCVLHFN